MVQICYTNLQVQDYFLDCLFLRLELIYVRKKGNFIASAVQRSTWLHECWHFPFLAKRKHARVFQHTRSYFQFPCANRWDKTNNKSLPVGLLVSICPRNKTTLAFISKYTCTHTQTVHSTWIIYQIHCVLLECIYDLPSSWIKYSLEPSWALRLDVPAPLYSLGCMWVPATASEEGTS